jgi:hypothetical protein
VLHDFLVQAIQDTSNVSTDPLTILFAYGPLGMLVAAFMFGWVHPASTVKRLEEQLHQKDEIIKVKDEQIITLQSGMTNEALPALIRSTDILDDFPDLERRISDNLSKLRKEIRDLAEKTERG